MIHRLYNPWHITNEGERAADRHFILLPGHEDELFCIIYQLRIASRYHRVQMAGECDFVILTQFGIMVMEVKGGLIGYGMSEKGDHGFYRIKGDNTKEAIKDPFLQADENADAILKYLRQKGLINVFVGRMACFPECVFDAEGIDIQYMWHLGLEKGLLEMVASILKDQVASFREKQELKNVALPVQWKTLEEADIRIIAELLKSEFEPRLYRTRTILNREESSRRLEEGMHILKGLDENRRIMVQGPPGSGKTTYALNLIFRHSLEEGKTGLFLCWNELLAAEMKVKLSVMDPSILDNKIHVAPLYRFVGELAELLGDISLQPTFQKVENSLMRHLIKECLSGLHIRKKLPRYDFIIADEAQDLFAKGLDLIIKYLLKDNNPIQKGNYHIFYDDRQAYPGTTELETYIRIRDTLKEASAFYMLFDNLRVNTGHGLSEFILDAGMGVANPNKEYGDDVKFISYKNPEKTISIIKQRIDQELTLSGESGQIDHLIPEQSDHL